MYLFPEDNLLILDCVDSIARIDDNLAPSALTLELFCYLISDHRIHHLVMKDVSILLLATSRTNLKPISMEPFQDAEPCIEQCETTMRALFSAGGIVDLRGGRMVTLLTRYPDKLTQKKLEDYEELKDDYKKKTEVRQINGKKNYKNSEF